MKNKRPLIIFGIAAIVILTCFIYFRSGKSPHNWTENYKEGSKEPYGTYVVKELLDAYFPEKSFSEINNSLINKLPTDSITGTDNYIFVGEGLYMDTSDVNTLLKFVENGNNAFISSRTIPYDLMFYVYYTECDNNYWDDYSTIRDSSITLDMLHEDLKQAPGLEYKYFYNKGVGTYRWQYIDSLYFCDEPYSFVELGAINDSLINFAKIPYGAGTFYLHTTPLSFSNIQMIDPKGLSYATKVFSHLPEGDIYWDNHSRVRESIGRRRNQNSSNRNGPRQISSEGPLKYILSQPPLAWAWYTALGLGLLYLLFRAKRTQRSIPVLEENKNTSLDFISTIGSLYFIQNDHRKLCLQKMRLFLSFIRERYLMSTNVADDTFFKRLSAKSEIPMNIIEQIFSFHKNINDSSYTSEQTLIEFHMEMDKFYKNCK